MAEVDRISSRARDCRASNEYEASWNSFVHGPLLDLAQYTSRHRMQVDVANLTTAQLSTHLKPRLATSDRPAQGKLVDFAILLRRSPAIDQGYFDLPLEDGSNTKTLNHTVHAPCIMRPIAVSIETKREGEGGVEGRTQLSVWVAAHFTRLGELVRRRLDKHAPPPVLPPLPLVLVQGATWSLLVAQRDSAGKTVCTSSSCVLLVLVPQEWSGKKSLLTKFYRLSSLSSASAMRLLGSAFSKSSRRCITSSSGRIRCIGLGSRRSVWEEQREKQTLERRWVAGQRYN